MKGSTLNARLRNEIEEAASSASKKVCGERHGRCGVPGIKREEGNSKNVDILRVKEGYSHCMPEFRDKKRNTSPERSRPQGVSQCGLECLISQPSTIY